jgi:hypothetical protein
MRDRGGKAFMRLADMDFSGIEQRVLANYREVYGDFLQKAGRREELKRARPLTMAVIQQSRAMWYSDDPAATHD